MRSLSSFGLLCLNPMRTRLASIYIRLVAFPIPCLILRISLRPFTPRHIEAILRLARLYSLWRPKQTGSTTTISKSCTHFLDLFLLQPRHKSGANWDRSLSTFNTFIRSIPIHKTFQNHLFSAPVTKPMDALPNTATLLKGFQHRLPQFQGISH